MVKVGGGVVGAVRRGGCVCLFFLAGFDTPAELRRPLLALDLALRVGLLDGNQIAFLKQRHPFLAGGVGGVGGDSGVLWGAG